MRPGDDGRRGRDAPGRLRSTGGGRPTGLVVAALTATAVVAGATGCGAGGSDAGDASPDAAGRVRVTRVADGDTVHVRTRTGDDKTVRLALVDAPESSTTRHGRTECGGTEAATFLRRLVDGRDVTLRRPGGEEHDRFGRSVAELAIDGRSVDEQLVAAGWAEPFRVPAADGGAAANRRIRDVADRARDDAAGVWRLCGGFGRDGR